MRSSFGRLMATSMEDNLQQLNTGIDLRRCSPTRFPGDTGSRGANYMLVCIGVNSPEPFSFTTSTILICVDHIDD